MKNFGKATKLYFNMSIGILSIIGALMAAGIFILVWVDPAVCGEDGYMNMMGSINVGQLLSVILVIAGGINMMKTRFFLSLPFAKTLFTTVPVIVSAGLSLIYGIIAAVIVILRADMQTLSDLLVLMPVNITFICLIVPTLGKYRFFPLHLLCVLYVVFSLSIMPELDITANGFGLPVQTACIIGALILVCGIALSLLITNIWWKKGNHTYRELTQQFSPFLSK